jgi:hypothetical protein
MGNAATLDIREDADARGVAAVRAASISWYVWCLTAASVRWLLGHFVAHLNWP